MLFFIPKPTASIHSLRNTDDNILKNPKRTESRTIDSAKENGHDQNKEESKRCTAHHDQCSHERRYELCGYEERMYTNRNYIAEVKKEKG